MTVPVFSVTKNKDLLIFPAQESIVLDDAVQTLEYELQQGEDFSELSHMQCAQQDVPVVNSVLV